MNRIIALALAMLFVAAPADAGKGKSHGKQTTFTIADCTGLDALREAAARWDAATVVRLPVVDCGSPASISVRFQNLGPWQNYAKLDGTTIVVNSYLDSQFPGTRPDWKRLWMFYEIGLALGLEPVCQIGSVMSGCQDGTGDVGLPQYPDAGDVAAMNAAYGR